MDCFEWMNEEAHARVKGESEKSLSLWKVKVNVQSVNAEVEFVYPVSAGGSVKFLPAE